MRRVCLPWLVLVAALGAAAPAAAQNVVPNSCSLPSICLNTDGAGVIDLMRGGQIQVELRPDKTVNLMNGATFGAIQFSSIAMTQGSFKLTFAAGGTQTADRTITWDALDASSTIQVPASTRLPILTQTITFAGPTAARTVTLPDAATTVPIATQQLTFAGPTAARTITFTDASGTVPYIGSAQTWTGVQTAGADVFALTSPKLVSNLHDTNGNIWLNIGATGSAVNYVKVTNAATGTAGPILAADGETNVDLKLAGKGTGKIHATTGSYGDITADVDGATITFNLATSNVHSVTLGGNRTLAVSNDAVGQTFLLLLKQDGTGTRTVTWFSGILWAGGGVAPTLTTTAAKSDAISCLVTTAGSVYVCFVVGQNF